MEIRIKNENKRDKNGEMKENSKKELKMIQEIEAVLELDNWERLNDILCNEKCILFERMIENEENINNIDIIRKRCMKFMDIYIRENGFQYNFFCIK
jgi:hypothetical protein